MANRKDCDPLYEHLPLDPENIAMKRTWPIIGVSDVQVSSKWYQTLLSADNNHPGDSTFAQVVDEDGTVLLVFIIGAITVILR